MRFLQSLLYGFVSGLAEFLPVSGQGHQALLMEMFGMDRRQPILDLMIHVALLLALSTASGSLFSKLRREKNLSAQSSKGTLRRATAKSLLDLRLVRTAAIPMLILMLAYLAAARLEFRPIALSVILIFNGIALYIPEFMRHGNKDARQVSSVETVLIGIASGLCALPGFSRVGMGMSAASACGADRHHTANWALMLSKSAIIAYIVFDIIGLIIYGFGGITFLLFLGYILASLLAFVGGYISVLLLRNVVENNGLSAFAFYSWGMALFLFFLYLIT